MSKLYLGIDTSNYTTSVALCSDGVVLANYKLPVRVKQGERGIRQSDAVFSHVQNLPQLMQKIGAQDLVAVGVSSKPRPIEGSYMPCFLAGLAEAQGISSLMGIPLYEFAHQEGHIMAALYSTAQTELFEKKFLAFHVSGGTTELLLVENGQIKKIGGTLDLNAGQAIDRIGVMLGLSFPAGAEMERISLPFEDVNCYSCVRGLECNLSGLENKASGLLKAGVDQATIAAFTLKSICRTLDKMTGNALKKIGKIPVLYAGGVMSNRLIAEHLSSKYQSYFASPAFSCDNAAGIALLCERMDQVGNHSTI
jgi:N6-L-threonylcarbamoyladenine synthase